MLKKALIALLIVVVVACAIAATKPDDFSVSRTATFTAPAETVFAQVNDLQKWNAWSPWAKLDPNAKNSFEGPQAGVGAVMKWAGNMNVGEGSMTITESRPNELVTFRLDFLKPFEATNTAEFTFKPEGNQTVVTWSMHGKSQVHQQTDEPGFRL